MPEFEPIIMLPAQPNEYQRKPGGGSAASPLVEVTRSLRQELIEQLSVVAGLAELPSAVNTQGVPLAITVRDQALAKSKRPYALLKSTDMTPVAAERRGEMISRATPVSVRALMEAIRTGESKADTYAISTFASFRAWDPVKDAFGFADATEVDALLSLARHEERPLRVELFPWLSPASVWAGRTTLESHLAEVGLPVTSIAGSLTRTALYLQVTEEASQASLESLFGIRSAVLAPTYATPGPIEGQGFRTVSHSLPMTLPAPIDVDVTVGVLDSGVSPGVLDSWVSRRWNYDLGPEYDPTHGTFVAGLIVASRDLNGYDDRFPINQALIYDAQILPAAGISEDLLIERLDEVLGQSGPTGPRVWNCSFNNPDHMDPVHYSPLGQELDLLARKHGVLFVQSAGNYSALRRLWPPDGSAGAEDGLANPAESVDSLTVGALSHRGGMTPEGAVSSYSRRGPSFGGQQKPEVVHWSGDVDSSAGLTGYGTLSIGPGDHSLESVGTSFSTPLVSNIAATMWRDLQLGQSVRSVDPVLVKGLVIHSATVANMPIADDHRAYYGAGVPKNDSLGLLDSPHTFTTVHEVDLRTGVNWEKRPFPMPDCLFNAEGKIQAVVTLTLAYAPVIDAAFGEECIRTSVEPSFGRYVRKDGKDTFEGKMGGSHDWERLLIERGKWSPVRTFRQVWPQGTLGTGDWALQLRLTARDSAIEPLVQKAFVIVTVEGLDEALPVYQDGLLAINALRYPNSLAVDAGRLRVTVEG